MRAGTTTRDTAWMSWVAITGLLHDYYREAA